MLKSSLILRAARALFASLALAALSACGGGSTTPLYAPGVCNPNTQIELANPMTGATAVNTSTNSILLVANGNGNTLYYNYTQFYVTLTSTGGTVITGSALDLVPGNGFKPFASDFYYSSSISGLVSGQTYGVKLYQSGITCTPVTVGSFST